MIYYIQMAETIFVLKVYSKTEQADISPEEIRRIAEETLTNDEDNRT